MAVSRGAVKMQESAGRDGGVRFGLYIFFLETANEEAEP